MSSADPMHTANVFLDSGRLSELVGAPCEARHLRHKPGLSTVAALHGPDGIHGWAQVATQDHDAKIAKAKRRAERAGLTIHIRHFDDLTLAHGPVSSDPMLIKAWRELSAPLQQRFLAGDVARYNPQRRAVLPSRVDGRDVSVRLHHTPRGAAESVARVRQIQAAGVPTVSSLGRTKHTSTWSWEGDADLATLEPDARGAAARRAGAALARLHAVEHSTPISPTATHDSLLQLADDLGRLESELGMRLLDLVLRVSIRDQDPVAAHGDFSADQVAVGGSHVWLLDLDRFGPASRGLDFGSFHAVELLEGLEPVTDELLSGYGGPSIDELRDWVFVGLARRIMDPLRDAEPDWHARIHERLDQLEQWAG